MRQYRIVDVLRHPENNHLEKKLMEDVSGIVRATDCYQHFISRSKSREETVEVHSCNSEVSAIKEIHTLIFSSLGETSKFPPSNHKHF